MTRRETHVRRAARPAIVGSAVVAALVLGVPGAAAFIQPQGRTFGATAGDEFSGVVASFLTDSPPPFSAAISWGDGGQSQGSAACTNCPDQPQSYTVSGSHTYAEAGTYAVVVSISGSQQSATAQSTASVSAAPTPLEPPTASFTSQPPSPVTGQTLVFDGSGSSARSGIVVRYEWTFGGGLPPTPCDGGAPAVHAVYDQPGTFQVTLKVTDSNGLTGSVTNQLQVADAGLDSLTGSAACGSATAGLAPGLRGPPSVKFTDPEELHYYDRAPAPLPVSGQVKAPEGIDAFCVTGPKPVETFPPQCDQRGVVLKGKFTVLVSGLKPGYNFFDAWVRDKVGRTWARADEVAYPPAAAAGEHVLRVFDGMTWLEGLAGDRALLDATLRLARGIRLDVTETSKEDRLELVAAQLRADPGVGVRPKLGRRTLEAIARLDGRTTVGDVVRAVAEARRDSSDAGAAKILPALRELIALGFLYPVG